MTNQKNNKPSLLESILTGKTSWRTYESDNFTVFDFETTNLDKGFAGNPRNRIVLATWYNPSRDGESIDGVHHKFGGEYEQHELVEAIRSSDFIVCQNGKFELQWLTRMGVPLHSIILFDTMLAEYVEAGNRRTPKDLGSLAKKHGVEGKNGLVSGLISAGLCPSGIPERWLVDYGVKDTWATYQIFLKQREYLKKESLLPVQFTRCLTTPVLADIELRGMSVCKEEVEREYKSTKAAYEAAEERLRTITGGINLNSPKQVSAFLYDVLGFREIMGRTGEPDRTDAGGRRTDEDAIKALKATTPEQQSFKDAFLAAKPLVKRLDTLTKLKGCSDEDNGILLANINQAVTATHRLSSSGKKWKLQYQNIDRTLKSMFSARNSGWLVGETDGSSLEFRGAMHLGRDPVGKEDIEKGRDPHLFTATVIFKTVPEAVTSELRTAAKPYTFKPLYGGNSGTKDELRYYAAFRDRYKHLYQVQSNWTYDVLLHKHLTTEWGLKFYWPDCKSSKSGYISHTTEIFNYPVQSFSTAEIIPVSLFCFWHRLQERPDLNMFLVNTVHDSIVVELPPEEEEEFHNLSRKSFLEDVGQYLHHNYNITMYVPLGCEVKVGSHWSKGKGKKYEQSLHSST